MTTPLQAPFIWFGGKRKVAQVVWDGLGDVDNYVEPFAGSLAVLLARPHRLDDGRRRAETVNDADNYLANFWRALAADPDTVAHHADWPVNETDLFARHLWLVNTGRDTLTANLEADPDWYDAKIAGWWVWGLNAWIGSGWCAGNGPWTLGNAGQGVNRKLPHLGDAGQGVYRKLPHLGDAGQGVYRQLPHLGDAGRGVLCQRPHLGTAEGDGVLPDNTPLRNYLRQLAHRLRNVRVCSGDWTRVVTTGALDHGTTVGIFLDPPYAGNLRSIEYATDDHHVSGAVREWALANGDNPRLRICLAGYDGEHDMPSTWRVHAWTANRAYGTAAGGTGGNGNNRHLERLWFSPHCLTPSQPSLFELAP